MYVCRHARADHFKPHIFLFFFQLPCHLPSFELKDTCDSSLAKIQIFKHEIKRRTISLVRGRAKVIFSYYVLLFMIFMRSQKISISLYITRVSFELVLKSLLTDSSGWYSFKWIREKSNPIKFKRKTHKYCDDFSSISRLTSSYKLEEHLFTSVRRNQKEGSKVANISGTTIKSFKCVWALSSANARVNSLKLIFHSSSCRISLLCVWKMRCNKRWNLNFISQFHFYYRRSFLSRVMSPRRGTDTLWVTKT